MPKTREVVIEPRRGLAPLDLAELWRHRELIGFLALRDLRARYKQSLLGATWAVLQPLLTALVFALLFSLLLGRERLPGPAGVPYLLATYASFTVWQLFARSVQAGSESLVANQHLITKVYFPRLVCPLAPILAALVDFAIAVAVLFAGFAVYDVVPAAGVWALPFLTLLALAAALAVSLWLAALNALYRDVRHALPFLVQLWMFATPVAYTLESVTAGRGADVRALFALNPMTGVVEGFRWALFGAPSPPWEWVAASAGATAVLLVAGAFFFQRLERVVADRV